MRTGSPLKSSLHAGLFPEEMPGDGLGVNVLVMAGISDFPMFPLEVGHVIKHQDRRTVRCDTVGYDTESLYVSWSHSIERVSLKLWTSHPATPAPFLSGYK